MVEILTRLYTNGHSSMSTLLEFILPMALVGLINLILTTVSFVRRSMGKRENVLSILLLLANILLPLLHLCMVMFKSPHIDSVSWGVAILILSLCLNSMIVAVFLVDRSLEKYTAVQFDSVSNRSKDSSQA